VTAARFARHARLRAAEEFAAVFERGTRIGEKNLTAVVVANEQGHARLGLAVPKKAVAQAVGRNRIKRQVRESFRAQQHRLPAADIVILARPGSGRASAVELRAILEKLWTRISDRCAPASSS
jgi:ribonuclease P protein component